MANGRVSNLKLTTDLGPFQIQLLELHVPQSCDVTSKKSDVEW